VAIPMARKPRPPRAPRRRPKARKKNCGGSSSG
jgi:hypothetical protein